MVEVKKTRKSIQTRTNSLNMTEKPSIVRSPLNLEAIS